MEDETISAVNFVPFETEASALEKIASIDAHFAKAWETRSTETYAVAINRSGVFYLPVSEWARHLFTPDELGRGVESLPPVE